MSNDTEYGLEIAVVGMAGRFPGAPTIDDFWRNMRAGVESVRDLSDEELRAAGVDDPTLADPRFVRRAADLADADRFDAAHFGFTRREAELMDPQFRVFLEDAWTALEDAGHLSNGREARVGVFAGASGASYLLNNVYANPRAAEALGAFQTSVGNERDYLATHVSYRLDLRGPSFVVQTACSTSLVAIHLACQSLLNRECDVALAGGVSIAVPQTSGYLYEEGGIASPDGRTRAFDAGAAGSVKGNGSGVVVLRRLEDALRDGDTIRAIVKGSAINNDGAAKVGFTAPSDEGQSGVVAEALAVAGVEPATVGYVEAHGTATALGDPVEVAALARAFGDEVTPGTVALGSVKTNVGHLDAAAGVAGFVKAVLALEREEIPPSLHFTRANPNIDFARSPFFVNPELRAWPRGDAPRRAGVSSFGIGGTNAHVVLEEAPSSARADRARPDAVLVLSASTESGLAAASEALAGRLESGSAPDLADVAYTLQVGRKRLAWRRAVVARDAVGAADVLRSASTKRQGARDERRAADVAFLFPGQGAQTAGMAAELYATEPEFRSSFDRCADLLPGVDLRDAVFTDGADDRLRETSLAQPALFAVEYALARLWMSWGVRPSAMAGHSVGEYVAACLARVFSLEAAVALVAERGRLMGSMPRGAMLAVALDERSLDGRLAGYPSLALAAVNGPDACVASGPAGEIARFEAELAATNVPSKRLHTSHAFHSAMMDPAVGAFEARVRAVRLAPPTIPFVSNVTGAWITADLAIDPAYWSGHLRRAVRFADDLTTLVADSSRVLLEVGPGTALASLARRVAGPEATIVSSLGRANEATDDGAAIAEALGRLWCTGVDVDWSAVHAGYARGRVPLPTYPFERERYWIDPDPSATRERDNAPAKNPDLAAWFSVPGWRRSLARPIAAEADATWLVLDDGGDLGRAVVVAAESTGARVATVRVADAFVRESAREYALDPRDRGQFAKLVRALRADGRAPNRVAHLWCAEPARLDAATTQDLGFFALVNLVQALGDAGETSGLRLVAATDGLFDVVGDAVLAPERATLVGVCRVAPQEYPGLSCRLVDVETTKVESAGRAIATELAVADREPVVAWRGGRRWVPSYERVRLDAADANPSVVREGGVYVLTGGAGPLELAISARLAAAGARCVAFLEAASAPELDAPGVEVVASRSTVLDVDAVDSFVASLRERFGRVDAVFHTAGDIGGGMLQLKERAAAERVLAPRVAGSRALVDALHDGETLVLFGSAISATGVFGQVDYCAASAYLDAIAASRDGASSGPRVLAIDWGTGHWDRWQAATGAGAEALAEQLREIQESVGITVEEGVEALWRALALGEPRVVVSPQDVEALVAASTSSAVADFLASAGTRPAERVGRALAPLDTDTERRVAGVWTEMLGVAAVGRTDNFFDLGGNSLLAIQLASRLRKTFDVDLTIASLFEAADLTHLASAVDAALDERREAEEVARLLAEIEGLSDDEIRAELAKSADAGRTE